MKIHGDLCRDIYRIFKFQTKVLGRDDDFLCFFLNKHFGGVDNDGTMNGNKRQGGFCWYRLIFIRSGSESPDV